MSTNQYPLVDAQLTDLHDREDTMPGYNRTQLRLMSSVGLPHGVYATQAWMRSLKSLAVDLHYRMFKRGYMAGCFGKGRWPTHELARVGEGALYWSWVRGWDVGREFRYSTRPTHRPKAGDRLAGNVSE